MLPRIGMHANTWQHKFLFMAMHCTAEILSSHKKEPYDLSDSVMIKDEDEAYPTME